MKRAAKIAGLLALVTAISYAQATATLSGTLFDPNGKVVIGTGTSVIATNTTTPAVAAAPVGANGSYRLAGLAAGVYDIAVPMSCCMYATYMQSRVQVREGESLTLDLKIRWGMNLGTIGDDPVMLTNDMRSRAKVPDGPAPRMADGKPDFNGVWATIPNLSPPSLPPLKQQAADIVQQRLATDRKDAPGNYCLPNSSTPSGVPFHYRFVQTPQLIVVLQEFDSPGYRQIYLDGRQHPEDWNPAWYGHSVGKWDGDTLVVDTVGFNDKGWLNGIAPQTEKLHVTEWIRRPDFGHLEIEITAEDPGVLSGPWKTRVRAGLLPNEDILEFVCENNKPEHMK
jgi:hypothetical protein